MYKFFIILVRRLNTCYTNLIMLIFLYFFPSSMLTKLVYCNHWMSKIDLTPLSFSLLWKKNDNSVMYNSHGITFCS